MRRLLRNVVTISTLALLLIVVGCGSPDTEKDENTDSIAAAPETAKAGDFNFGVNDDSDSGKLGSLKTVYFAFDSFSLNGDTRMALDSAITFLKETTSIQVRVEGHCDERGSDQYNYALGESRANSIKNYLVSNGVDAGRIETISYGKGRPIAFDHNESSWSQNRRGNFVITAK